MRRYAGLAAVMICMLGAALAAPPPVDPGSFSTKAKFSVDNTALSLSSAVAIIEARRYPPGYSWLRVYFYSFPLTAEDAAGVANGNIDSLEKKWTKTANDPPTYNRSHAVIQLSVDSAHKVWQADMSVPGHTCTIAPFEPDVKKFLQDYQFDGKRLRLKSKGTYVCDMKFMGIPNQNFGWDIDLSVPVFQEMKSGN
ncbi:MAG TPA: hypothetical protein VJO53_05300 [Candidatus Acidoferrales bacterium]|nr:hypothetical protein [Candidatus Acidoferrales bacterium]